MDLDKYLPLIISVVSALGGAYIIVKITLAELKKDILHINEKFDGEAVLKIKTEREHSENMKEVSGDVKAIFRILTKIQIDQAEAKGRDNIVKELKEAIVVISKK